MRPKHSNYATRIDLQTPTIMKPSPTSTTPFTTRRDFLKHSGQAVAGAALAGALARPGYAADNNTIKVALVGCGGRGTGAAMQALSTSGPTKLWAAADVFEDRLTGSLSQLKQRLDQKVDVARDREFLGTDAFKQAIDTLDKGDVVLLTTPPAFRPIHLEYAIQKGVHVFMEKSFAVDAPGIRQVLALGRGSQEKEPEDRRRPDEPPLQAPRRSRAADP